MARLNARYLSSVDQSEERLSIATPRKQSWPHGKGNSPICSFKAIQFEIGTFNINKSWQPTSWIEYIIFLTAFKRRWHGWFINITLSLCLEKQAPNSHRINYETNLPQMGVVTKSNMTLFQSKSFHNHIFCFPNVNHTEVLLYQIRLGISSQKNGATGSN